MNLKVLGSFLVIFVLAILLFMPILGFMAITGGTGGDTGTTDGGSNAANPPLGPDLAEKAGECNTLFNSLNITLPAPNESGFIQLPRTDYYKRYGKERAKWGTPQLVKVITCVSKQFADMGYGKFGVGDMSARNGGALPPHKSHKTGKDADLDLNDAINWYTSEKSGRKNPNYNKEASIALAKLFIAAGVTAIGFDEPEMRKSVNTWAAENNFTGRVCNWGGHKSHFHISLYGDC